MAINQVLTFLYDIEGASAGVVKSNSKTPLVIKELIDWSFEDKLNKLIK